jgi:uncharacterized protein (TIGR00375 family)
MLLPVMSQVAKEKGLDILTVSDWTHPLWMKEIKSQIEEAGEGIYRLKDQANRGEKETLFIFTTEISSIFKQNDKLRRIHNLIFAPTLQVAEKITAELQKRGANVSSDGRPIIGLSSKQLLELVLQADDKAMLIPCHVWTPHFGMYGSASGFDSIEESFGDLSEYIYGIETGLSSDPEMNWEIEELKNRSILSFSDAHSQAKMGREATVMELERADYPSIRDAIRRPMTKKGNSKIVYTIEFYPEEGKYHFTGHRDCKVSRDPDEVAKKGVICPVCHRKMTEGVLKRVQTLAGDTYSPRATARNNEMRLKWLVDKDKTHPPFVKMVPLLEIVAESMESTVMSQKVKDQYQSVVSSLGTEIDVLLKIPVAEIRSRFGAKLAEGIQKVRKGDLLIIPGFDNQYGIVKIWGDNEAPPPETDQMSLL